MTMAGRKIPLEGHTVLRKKAQELLEASETSEEVRRKWLALAEEAAKEGDYLLSEYAYKKALGLRVLW